MKLNVLSNISVAAEAGDILYRPPGSKTLPGKQQNDCEIVDKLKCPAG